MLTSWAIHSSSEYILKICSPEEAHGGTRRSSLHRAQCCFMEHHCVGPLWGQPHWRARGTCRSVMAALMGSGFSRIATFTCPSSYFWPVPLGPYRTWHQICSTFQSLCAPMIYEELQPSRVQSVAFHNVLQHHPVSQCLDSTSSGTISTKAGHQPSQ